MKPTVRRSVLAATGAAALALSALAAPVASAQQPLAVDVKVGDGSVECRVNSADGGDAINCVSATEAAHRNHAECNPPNALVPSVWVQGNQTTVGCWNQGSDQPERYLAPGEPAAIGQNLFWADFGGGLHVVTLQGQYGYAGPEGVSGAFNPATLSSF